MSSIELIVPSTKADFLAIGRIKAAVFSDKSAVCCGTHPEEGARAYRIMRTFKRHDEEGLLKLFELWGDDQAYGLRVRESIEQLEKVLRDDSEESEDHFREAWKSLRDAETRRFAED